MLYLLELLLAVAVVAGGTWFIVATVRSERRQRRARAIASARWRAAHASRDGRTRVVVVLTAADPERTELDSREVAVIGDDDPDYDRKFLDAMLTARERAEILNLET